MAESEWDPVVLDRPGLDRLVEALRAAGYRVVGPTVRDGAIVLDELASAASLPAGWTADAEPGRYRLRRRGDPDGSFVRARRAAFVVAAHRTEPSGVCFCASMGTGPAAGPGYDLALTERIDEQGHRFVVEVGTPEGSAGTGRCAARRRLGRRTGRGRAAGWRTRPPGWAGGCPRWTCPRCCASPASPRTGTRRRPLPDLRQLHDGVPDVPSTKVRRTPDGRRGRPRGEAYSRRSGGRRRADNRSIMRVICSV